MGERTEIAHPPDPERLSETAFASARSDASNDGPAARSSDHISRPSEVAFAATHTIGDTIQNPLAGELPGTVQLRPGPRAGPGDELLSIQTGPTSPSEMQFARTDFFFPFINKRGGEITSVNGLMIGRYQVLDIVGSGGMGIVYAARDLELDRRVAIKVLRPEASGWDAGETLLEEAKTMARLSHPNVCTVYEAGTTEGSVFIAMEYVDGETLSRWLLKSRSWQEIVAVIVAVGRGLQAAHDAGVIHRDLKPENIMIGYDGRVRVMDFGIAKATSLAVAPSGDIGIDLGSGSTDETVGLVGTPAYMAPELLRGQPADERSDQFALAVTLFEALTGERPYEGRTLRELIKAYEAGARTQPSGARNVPSWLLGIVDRGIAMDRERRYSRVSDLADKLEWVPRRRRNFTIGALGAGILVCAAISMLILYQRSKAASNPCLGGEARVAEVWNAERRARIEATLHESGIPMAGKQADLVARLVDDYASDWAIMHRDACEDTRVRGEQSEEMLDRRMACLNTRHAELDGLLAILGETDRQVAQHAFEAVLELDDIEHCGATAALLTTEAEPSDPDRRSRLDALRGRYTMAKARHDAGQYRAVQPETAKLVEDAREFGYQPLLADALLLKGRVLARVSEYREAEKSLIASLWAAERSGHDLSKAEALIDLIMLVGWDLHRYKDGLRWTGFAQATLSRIGGHARLRGRFLRNQAAVVHRMGDFGRSLELHKQALAIKHEEYGQLHVEVALTLNDLGSTSLMLGRLDEAVRYHQEALACAREVLGEHHPIAAEAINNLGNAHFRHGQLEEARERYQQALDIWRAFFGEQHRHVATGLSNLGNVSYSDEDYEQAISFFRQAVRIEEALLGKEHVEVGRSLSNLGAALFAAGDIPGALRALERALRNIGDNQTVTGARVRVALARALLETGENERSLKLALEAKGMFRALGESVSAELAELEQWLRDEHE